MHMYNAYVYYNVMYNAYHLYHVYILRLIYILYPSKHQLTLHIIIFHSTISVI